MSRTLAVIAGAIILFVAALSASIAFVGKGSSGTSPNGGPAPAQTMIDSASGSHQMPDGSTMGGMDMAETGSK